MEKTATFIGHGECWGVDKEKVRAAAEELIQKGVETFLSGGMGGFDWLGARVVYELKEKYPHIKNILVIPYLTFNVRNKDLFDENKLQPQYGVTSINGHPIDEQVTHTLNNIREKLGAYKLSGNMFTAGELKKIVTSSDNNHNIETRNECTKW